MKVSDPILCLYRMDDKRLLNDKINCDELRYKKEQTAENSVIFHLPYLFVSSFKIKVIFYHMI